MPGGVFLKKTTGDVAQVLQSAPRTKKAKQWAEDYNMPMLASFTLKKYEEGPASGLGLYWCQKCQLLYDIWANQPDVDYEFRAGCPCSERARRPRVVLGEVPRRAPSLAEVGGDQSDLPQEVSVVRSVEGCLGDSALA
eukprot:1780724-Lingulodinium_polyedra.AAC.1